MDSVYCHILERTYQSFLTIIFFIIILSSFGYSTSGDIITAVFAGSLISYVLEIEEQKGINYLIFGGTVAAVLCSNY